ncbi:MAG: ABC transporter substrate-binding protein [Anaerolineae bacterium]|nr:ABC transporter substrate-binding protein [Anaerolineae bacterium]
MSYKQRSMIVSILIILVVLALAGCQGQKDEAIELYMGFRPDVQFTPFYVGIEKGFFADHGLDVTTHHEASESTMARLVATGEIKFAVLSGEQVLLGRAEDLSIVYFYEWFQQFPVGVAAKQESGIAAPADLEGRSVGVPVLSGASYIGFEALLSTAGLSDSDISLEATGFTQTETLMTDRVDAVVIYTTNEPVQLEAQNVAVNLIRVSDYADLVSNGLVTSEAMIEEEPETVRAIAAAFSEALQYTIDHPEEAYEIAAKYVEGLNDPDVEATQKAVLANSIAFWKGEQLGYSDRGSWEEMQDLLLDMRLLDAPQNVDEVFSNEFLP